MNEKFRIFSESISWAVGTPWAFTGAVAAVVLWLLTGPMFAYSDAWQLVINTSTTIITFLMVFVIQNTQNRASRVVELKLDELLRAVTEARTEFVSLDHLTDQELLEIRGEFERLSGKAGALLHDDLQHLGRELKDRAQADQ
jgi:low affinity Fe/Cu permease